MQWQQSKGQPGVTEHMHGHAKEAEQEGLVKVHIDEWSSFAWTHPLSGCDKDLLCTCIATFTGTMITTA